MAYIISAAIYGIGQRGRSLEIEFDRHQNIVWGLNGSGKTTLLRVLSAALSNDPAPLAKTPVTEAVVQIHSHTHGQITRRYEVDPASKQQMSRNIEEVNWLIEESGIDANVARLLAADRIGQRNRDKGWQTTFVDSPTSPNLNRLTHQYLSINRLVRDLRGTRNSNNSVSESVLDEAFSERVNEQWIRYQATSLSEIREIQQQGLGQVLSVLFGGPKVDRLPVEFSPTDPDHAYALTRDFLRAQRIKVNFSRETFLQLYQRDRQYPEVVEHIKRVTESVDRALRPQRELERLVAELYTGNKHLYLGQNGIEVRVGEESIPLQALSSGERQLLFILLQVMAGNSDSVIVDEPEISLHVDWQERLVEAMRTVNPDCQLILATHSPDVMANVDSKYIRQI